LSKLNAKATSRSQPTIKEWKMPRRLSFIFAAALMMVSAGQLSAQTGTPPDPGAAANVRQSQAYEQMLRSNPSLRRWHAAGVRDDHHAELQRARVSLVRGPRPDSATRKR
jgi:hypothetical protein